jgi:hypothetical protein
MALTRIRQNGSGKMARVGGARGKSTTIYQTPQPLAGELSGTPNQPNGYIGIVDQAFNEVLFTDSGVTWLNGAGYPNGEASVTLLTDASAPQSPSNTLRYTYPSGYDSDNGPGLRECVFGEFYDSIYTCLWLRPSVTWEDHPSGINKLFYWTTRNTPEQNGTALLNLRFSGANPVRFDIITQNPNAPDQVTYQTSGFTPLLGEWHRIEVLQERTSGILGRVRMWASNESNVTSVLCMDETGVQLTDDEETTLVWRGVNFDPVWGGNTAVSTREFTLDYDHMILSGVPN